MPALRVPSSPLPRSVSCAPEGSPPRHHPARRPTRGCPGPRGPQWADLPILFADVPGVLLLFLCPSFSAEKRVRLEIEAARGAWGPLEPQRRLLISAPPGPTARPAPPPVAAASRRRTRVVLLVLFWLMMLLVGHGHRRRRGRRLPMVVRPGPPRHAIATAVLFIVILPTVAPTRRRGGTLKSVEL